MTKMPDNTRQLTEEEIRRFRPRITVNLGGKCYELNRPPEPPKDSPFWFPELAHEPCDPDKAGLGAFPTEPNSPVPTSPDPECPGSTGDGNSTRRK